MPTSNLNKAQLEQLDNANRNGIDPKNQMY